MRPFYERNLASAGIRSVTAGHDIDLAKRPTYTEVTDGYDAGGGTTIPTAPYYESYSAQGRLVTLKWQAQDGLTAPHVTDVQRKKGTGGTYASVGTVPRGTYQFTDAPPLDVDVDSQPIQTDYYYRIRFRTTGSSPQSSAWTETGVIGARPFTAADLGANIIDAKKIVDAAITNAKLENLAVDAAKLAAAAVTNAKLADNAVSTTKIVDDAISSAKIAAGAVLEAALASGAVTTTKISDGAISSPKVQANAVEAAAIAAGAVIAEKIATGAVTADKILAGAVTTGKLAAGAVTANEIAALAVTAAKLAAGAVTAEKLLVAAPGSALNEDPGMRDPSAWVKSSGGDAVFITVTDGKVGNHVMRDPGGTAWYNGQEKIPVDPDKTYRVRCWARDPASADGNFYVGVALQDENGANITGDGGQWYYATIAASLSSSWSEHVGLFGAGTAKTFPANARTMRPLVILNYQGTTGYMEVQDLRIEEVLPSTLIKDGAITTDKLFADAVTAAKIEAGTITADEIAVNTIIGGNIKAGEFFTKLFVLAAGGIIQSANYAAGSAGFRIHNDGSAELNNIVARGTIHVGSGSSGVANLSDAGALAQKDQVTDTDLNSTKLNGIEAGATVGADWNQNLGSIPHDQIYSADDAHLLQFNSLFADWPAGQSRPTGWSAWNSSPKRETSYTVLGGVAARFTTDGINQYGMYRSVSLPGPTPADHMVVGTLTYRILTLNSGVAGLLVDLGYDSTYRRTTVTIDTSAVGGWARQKFVAKVPLGKQITYIRVYVMGSYSGFPGGVSNLDIVFDNFAFSIIERYEKLADVTSVNQSASTTSLSNHDADALAESVNRKWAGESGADVTGSHRSASTDTIADHNLDEPAPSQDAGTLKRSWFNSAELRFQERPNNSSEWSDVARVGGSLRGADFYGDVLVSGKGREGAGKLWRSIANPLTAIVRDVGYGNGVFVAVTSYSEIARSTDYGETWSGPITNPFNYYEIRAVAFGNEVFVAVGQGGRIARSTDYGQTWGSLITNPFTSSTMIEGVAFGNGVFVAVGRNGEIARSTDNGQSWGSLVNNPFGTSSIWAVAFGNGVFVATADSSVARSTDNGQTWGQLISTSLTAAYCIAFGNGVFAIGGFGAELARSTDNGLTWTLPSNNPFTSTPDDIHSIMFGGGVFVAAGSYGALAYSVDNGASWSEKVTIPFSNHFQRGCYGASRFLIGGSDGLIGLSEEIEFGAGIIEKGENDNGTYVKFSDGTMVCFFVGTVQMSTPNAYGSLYQGLKDVDYPEPFIESPTVTIGRVQWSSGASWGNLGASPGISNFSLRLIDVAQRATDSTGVTWTATGRWK